MAFPLKQIVHRQTRLIRVSCPYCPGGHGIFKVVTANNGTVEGNAREPVKCVECMKYFQIKPQIVFKGVPMEQAPSRNGQIIGS